MSTPTPDPAAVIAQALAALRPRRQGPVGPGPGPRRRIEMPADGVGDGAPEPGDGPDRFGGRAHPGHQRRAGHAGHAGLADHAEHLGRPGGRNMAAMRMLDALHRADHALSVSEIAEAIGVDQPRASRLVQQMVERQLVRREADENDARRTRVALTEAGREFALRATQARQLPVEQALEHFDDAERAELARLLAKLAAHWPG